MSRISEILVLPSSLDDYQIVVDYVTTRLINIPNISYEFSPHGDILVTKGKAASYPTFICYLHGQSQRTPDIKAARLPKNVWVTYKLAENGTINQVGFGYAKLGIHLCLKLLKDLPEAKVVFYAKQFSSASRNIEFFKDSRWVVEPTKNGGNEIYTSSHHKQLAGEAFTDEVLQLGKKYNFKADNTFGGILPDLRREGLTVSGILMSVGTYCQHSYYEQLVEADLVATLELCKKMAKEMTDTYTLIFKKKTEEPPANQPSLLLPPAIGIKTCQSEHCQRVLINNEKYYCSLCITSLRTQGRHCTQCGLRVEKDFEFFAARCQRCIELPSGRQAVTVH